MTAAVAPASRRTDSPATASATIDWLLDERRPAVRRLALMSLVGRAADDPDVRSTEAGLTRDPWVAELLRDRAVHAYQKWAGAHWRLVALAELGVSREIRGAASPIEEGFEAVLGWLLSPGHRDRKRLIAGRHRACASQEGAALWAACRLGLGGDRRLDELAERLVTWQWPDGGWNCDKRPGANHASFNESWMPLRGLVAYAADGATPPEEARAAGETGDRAATFLLRHRVVESERTGALAHPKLEWLRWPAYWHFGLLPGLRALDEAGYRGDPAAAPALERLRRLRGADGRWRPDGRWWARPGRTGSNVEIVDWGQDGESAVLTLHALQLLGTDA